jgi:hypothetical protein
MDKIASFFGSLFVDRMTAGDGTNPAPFNFVAWLIPIGIVFLVSSYYKLEGRRKIPGLKDHTIWKRHILDPMTSQLLWWSGVGGCIMFFKAVSPSSLFSWNLWLVAWGAWGAGIVFVWGKYLIKDYNRNMDAYNKMVER